MTDATLSGAAPRAPAEPIWTRRTAAAAGVLLALIALADISFFHHEPGVSLAIFCLALTLGVLAIHPRRLGDGQTALLAVVAILAALPLAQIVRCGCGWRLRRGRPTGQHHHGRQRHHF